MAKTRINLSTFVIAAVVLSLYASPARATTIDPLVVDPPSICDSLPGNLVTNCGFESGSFSGWALSGNTGFTLVTSSAPYVNSGTYGAQLGPVGSDGFLTQVLTTTAGAPYTFGFYLYNDPGTPNHFSASWDGVPVFSVTDAPSSPYTLHTSSVLGTGSDTIQFAFRQDPRYWGLDDVEVTGGAAAIPEPASLLLLGTGLVSIGRSRMRKRS